MVKEGNSVPWTPSSPSIDNVPGNPDNLMSDSAIEISDDFDTDVEYWSTDSEQKPN